MRRPTARNTALAVVVAAAAVLTVTAAAAPGADRPAQTVATWDQLARLADRQGLVAYRLLGNDSVNLNGSQTSGLVRQRVRHAWSAAKRIYFTEPVDRGRVDALDAVVARHVASDRRSRSDDRTGPPTQRELDSVELRLLNIGRGWPGERDIDARRRLSAVLTVDAARYGGGRFERALDTALKADGNGPASGIAQALCGALTLGPAFQGLLADVFLANDGLSSKVDDLRGRCQQKTDEAAQAVKELPGKIAEAAWTGALGDAVTELQKGVAWLTKQVGKGMDATLKVNFGEAWLSKMLGRSAAVAVVIGMLAYLAGLGMAVLRADPGAGAGVIGRAMLTGIIGGALLSLLQLAVAVTSELTALLLGGSSASAGEQMQLLAQTTSAALQDAEAPAVIALLMMILLLVALLVVWLELLVREPLLYLLAFWYAPAYAASAFAPARRVVSTLNGLLVAVVLMPMIVVGSLAFAAEAMAGADDLQGVLTSIVLLLMAAASPLIVMMILEPGGTFATGAAAAIGGGSIAAMAGRASRAAGAGRSAAAFAGDRIAGAGRQQTTGSGRGASAGSGGGGAAGTDTPTGAAGAGAPDGAAPSSQLAAEPRSTPATAGAAATSRPPSAQTTGAHDDGAGQRRRLSANGSQSGANTPEPRADTPAAAAPPDAATTDSQTPGGQAPDQTTPQTPQTDRQPGSPSSPGVSGGRPPAPGRPALSPPTSRAGIPPSGPANRPGAPSQNWWESRNPNPDPDPDPDVRPR